MQKSFTNRPPVSANEEQLAKVFSQNTYIEVPRFQRSYAWDVDEYGAFWEDVQFAFASPGSHVHFLGALVFSRIPERPGLHVLDGQQRLTTLFLLVSAIRDVAKDFSTDGTLSLLAEDLVASLRVTVTVDGKAKRIGRLRANRQDREFFESLLSESHDARPKHESHRLLQKARRFLVDQVRDLASTAKDPASALASLWDTLRNQFWYIDIVCEEEINAQVVFESLNAKGEDLSTADLLKNFLFLEIERTQGSEGVDEADRKWTSMIDSLGKDTWLPNYVHAFWSSRYSYIREDAIYAALKQLVATGRISGEKFLHDLTRESAVYSEIRNPSNEYWTSPAVARMLREMKMLNLRVTHGVILALRAALVEEPQTLEAVLRRLLNFMVRYSKVTEQPTNRIDRELSDWARRIRTDGGAVHEFSEWLRNEAPPQQHFIESFKALKIRSGPTARLMLMKLNNAMNVGSEPEAMIADLEKVTLEHIIPQNPSQEWVSFLGGEGVDLEDVLYRVGNLTLLTGPKNIAASNRDFRRKRDEVYRPSSLPMNQNLVLKVPDVDRDGGSVQLLERFGLAELNERQARLATLAEELWRVD